MVSPGPQLPTLKSLDRQRRVVHLGSFSKTRFPGARVGFAVADQRRDRRGGPHRSAGGRARQDQEHGDGEHLAAEPGGRRRHAAGLPTAGSPSSTPRRPRTTRRRCGPRCGSSTACFPADRRAALGRALEPARRRLLPRPCAFRSGPTTPRWRARRRISASSGRRCPTSIPDGGGDAQHPAVRQLSGRGGDQRGHRPPGPLHRSRAALDSRQDTGRLPSEGEPEWPGCSSDDDCCVPQSKPRRWGWTYR